jgi:hypothetical protein
MKRTNKIEAPEQEQSVRVRYVERRHGDGLVLHVHLPGDEMSGEYVPLPL